MGDEIDRKENAILAFEITTEKFVEVPCPDDHHGLAMIVGQYQGKLCFYHDEFINYSFDLWVMNEYKVRESWTKVFNIQTPEGFTYSLFGGHIKDIVLCSTKEGYILMRSSEFDDKCLILYDPKHRTPCHILGTEAGVEVNSYAPKH
ncbi:hypothetical protein FRX31_029926 [Thalictrum thalictroides]|uniref:F-box associated beta-propeller type 3 domain-containing protein n=1 Tax=Thalictrum thalictroides TaxID=46969 RepID=A0A7J6V5Y5_THATH|nr:hypothetical protein FRX31_029926 [Thalictrum thalictroides]